MGFSGTGTFNQSGGTNEIRYNLYLGYNSNSHGTYNFENGQLLGVLGEEDIGCSGTGTFNQSGGRNMPPGLRIACNLHGNGTYNLSGTGILYVMNFEAIGDSGTGTFNQSGGSNEVGSVSSGSLYLGSGKHSASGTYNLSGTGYLSSYLEYIGDLGTGTFNQYGGNNMAGCLYLGSGDGLHVSGSGTYNLSGTGQLYAGSEYIGEYGTGIFNQSGGTNSMFSGLDLGYHENASGTYNLSNTGELSAPTEYVGDNGSGAFNQSGGTNTVSNSLYIGFGSGKSSSYNLSGTGQLSANEEYLGCYGTGTFNQSGGTNTTSNLFLGGTDQWSLNNGSGTYIISNGILDVRNGAIQVGNYGTGQFNLNGGLVIADQVNLSSSGSFYASGTGTLRVNSLIGLEDILLECTLQLGHSGGANSGSYSLGDYHMCLIEGDLAIGYDAPATFNQSGGSINWICCDDYLNHGSLFLASNPSATGIYNFCGPGELWVYGSEFVGYLVPAYSTTLEESTRFPAISLSGTITAPITSISGTTPTPAAHTTSAEQDSCLPKASTSVTQAWALSLNLMGLIQFRQLSILEIIPVQVGPTI